MKRGTSTRAAAVITHLHELTKAAVPNGVEVLDGTGPGDEPDDCVVIAPADVDNPGAVVSYGKAVNLGNAPVEITEVAIVCRSFAGDTKMDKRRDRCAEMVAAIQGVVRAHPTRDGIWDKLEMGENTLWHPVHTDQGVNCYVALSVIATGLL